MYAANMLKKYNNEDDNENKKTFFVDEVCATDSKITSVNLANIIMECAYFSVH